jgi:c-di-AMP phosphodiesterase-like protein
MKGELDAFANVLFDGFKAHKDVRVEFLTISVPRGSGIDLEASFKILITRIVGRKRTSAIQYAGVLVGSPPEHAHILWVKPYVRYEVLNRMWHNITKGKATGIVSKTIRGDKSKRNEMRRTVYYIVEQENHHGLPFTFIRSHRWLKGKKQSQNKEQAVLGA